MRYYLFVAADIDIGTSILRAPDLCEARISRLAWPLSYRTPNKHKLESGDKVVFYVAGRGSGIFLGTTTLLSGAFAPSSRDKQELLVYDDESLGPAFFVRFEKVDFFSTPVKVRTILGQLQLFAGAGKHWGLRLSRGVKEITARDYQVIIESVNKHASRSKLST